MSVCELRRATLYDTDAVYALICELKQGQFDLQAFSAGYAANLQDANMHYQLAQIDGQVVGLIGLHLQFHLHHANWIGETGTGGDAAGARVKGWQQPATGPGRSRRARSGRRITELSTSTQRLDAHRFYQREGYTHEPFSLHQTAVGEP